MNCVLKPLFVGVASFVFVASAGAQQSGATEQSQGPAQSQSQGQGSQSQGQGRGEEQRQVPASAAMTARGELVKVDTTAKMLTVKTATGEMEFKYNDGTKIAGAERTIAGLGTSSGSQVVVQYRKDGSANVASNIDVRPAQGPAAPPDASKSAPAPPSTTPPSERPTPPLTTAPPQ